MNQNPMRELFAKFCLTSMLFVTVAFTGCPSRAPSGTPINTSQTSSVEATADPKSDSKGDEAASSASGSSDSNLAANTGEQAATEVQSAGQSTGDKIVGSDAKGTKDAGKPTKGSSPLNSNVASNKIPTGNWTTQRLIAPTTRGPAVIDLKLQVGESDLDSASSSAMEPIAKSLMEKLEAPPSWSALVELPLVKSGWLGNLTAESGSVDQLVNLYDKNKDKQVQSDELNMFLTRGLARSATVLVSDAGTEPSDDPNNSPLGILDTDQDNVLSVDELDHGAEQLRKLDFNGDLMITLNELATNGRNSATMMGGRRSMLKTTSLIFEPPANPTENESSRAKQRQRKSIELMEIYTFLGQIEPQQWPDWNKERWSTLDVNNDGSLGKSELSAIFDKPLALAVALRLPSLSDELEIPKWFAEVSDQWIWSSSSTGARVAGRSLCLQIEMEESFNKRTKSLLKSQLNLALNNPQLQQFLAQQLQLKENAMTLADANGDKQLQDDEFAMVWSWLSARQSARLQARWMLSARPWFQLLDTDGNQSLSEQELQQVKSTLLSYDADADGEIGSGELPMVVKLRISRTDNRLNLPPGMQPAVENLAGEDDWFSAMDTNRDGSISRAEFLGSDNDFQDSDKDRDGFISKTEVY